MSHKNNRNLAVRTVREMSDAELIDELDDLMKHAAEGDVRAVGALAIGFAPLILEEARVALGEIHKQDDADVMQDFMEKLLEKKLRFPSIRGAAIPWMRRMVRVIAQEHLRKMGPPPWDLAG